ncbi:MAG: hypothetical protein R3C11_14460 [Planctomycetaceae bacterium]
MEKAEEALRLIQKLDPSGVGARNVKVSACCSS